MDLDLESIVEFRIFLEMFKNEIQHSVDSFVDKVLKKSLNATEAPIILTFDLNYNRLASNPLLEAALGAIVSEPVQAIEDIRAAVWLNIFTDLTERFPQLKNGVQLQQIHCIIRFSNLPISNEFKFTPFRHPIRLSLSVMRCILYSFNERYKFVRQSTWYCAKQCNNNQKHIFASEMPSNGKCFACGENLEENEVRI